MITTLSTLSEDLKDILQESHILKNSKEYQSKLIQSKKSEKMKEEKGQDLFSSFNPTFDKSALPSIKVNNKKIIWATDNYLNKGKSYSFNKPIHDVEIIIPRSEKSKEDQKRRVKEKAEVFTPSWVCNLQNNLIDDNILGTGAFNTSNDEEKTWISRPEKIKFTKEYSWADYVSERRLEACCGEGPYLMSPYDTVTGQHIPVRDENGVYQRIGILDRKLRVISENLSKEDWVKGALIALKTTFGYEWQGDNLILARLNFLNTFIEYYMDYFGESPNNDLLKEVAEIASWNLWQMDGLKMVVPMTCSKDCLSCKNKKRAGHDGVQPVIRFFNGESYNYITFEKLLPVESF